MKKKKRHYYLLVIILGCVALAFAWQWETINLRMSVKANWGKKLPLFMHVTDIQSNQGFGGDGEVYAIVSYRGTMSLTELKSHDVNKQDVFLNQRHGSGMLSQKEMEQINTEISSLGQNLFDTVEYDEWLKEEQYYSFNEKIKNWCYFLNDKKNHRLYIVMNFM